jgi:hypothetical protein
MEVSHLRPSGVILFAKAIYPGYFKNSSPDFINYKGQSLSGPQQVEALAQAQSIGMCDR